jgi:Protein of unknown function (DUF3754)
MAEFTDREHYIPLRKSDLIDLLSKDKALPVEEREPFRRFCRQVSALFHFEYLKKLEELKDAYAPFDPDSETRPLKELGPEERQKSLDRLFTTFTTLMERANFTKLSWADVQAAMADGASDWGINMDVDARAFERVEIFCRGDQNAIRYRKKWFKKKESVKVPTYKRLVFILKLRKHKRLADVKIDDVYMKIFKDIPKLDLEMLLPAGKVQWPKIKFWTFWGLLAGNLAYLLFKVSAAILAIFGALYLLSKDPEKLSENLGKAWEVLTAAAVLGPVAILGGFSYRQYAAYQKTKQSYSLLLTQSLYYQNLDNNAGVLTRLLDEAEEQECREVLLGYYCLWKYGPPQGWNSEQLDDYVELFLEGSVNLKVDFEIGDALEKLERLGLVRKVGSFFHAVPLGQAVLALEQQWQKGLKE